MNDVDLYALADLDTEHIWQRIVNDSGLKSILLDLVVCSVLRRRGSATPEEWLVIENTADAATSDLQALVDSFADLE